MSGTLEPYQHKRDFTRTPEPSGQAPAGETAGGATDASPPPSSPRRVVVYRHRARRPPDDLRLEINGVVASWAVPKAPARDPDVKRISVRVADDSLEYPEL